MAGKVVVIDESSSESDKEKEEVKVTTNLNFLSLGAEVIQKHRPKA